MTIPSLPIDHQQRLERALLSLEGLSLGDAFGQQFFSGTIHDLHFANRTPPPGPWLVTDDTVMTLSLIEILKRFGYIHQDELAQALARRYIADPNRGYGSAAHGILQRIHEGTPWQQAAGAVFRGAGSLGNGAAMRVAPLGAYFADDLQRVVQEADASAAVTHSHAEGRAGAIAVAVTAALAWQWRDQLVPGRQLLHEVARWTPNGATRNGLQAALALEPDTSIAQAVEVLGNGEQVTAADTVPLAVWLSARHLDDFPSALWAVIEAGGDLDTLGAIVGGVVALNTPRTIPPMWLARRESLLMESEPTGSV